MDITQNIVLSIVQGVTEFLPVSSSAHLVLISKLFQWPKQGIDFDIILHLGTLVAVLLYFRHILLKLCNPFYNLTLKLIIATLPVCIVGLLLKDFIDYYLRADNLITLVIAASTIIFGLLLGFGQYKECNKIENVDNISYCQSFIIGIAQCLALIPGASRLGVTMTAGLLLGLNRKLAAEFSFLLSIPVIGLSGAKVGYELIKNPNLMTAGLINYLLGFIISAIVAILSINLFLKLLNKVGVMPFVIYRLILGSILIVVASTTI